MNGRYFLIVLLALFVTGCHKPSGQARFHFTFSVDGKKLELDTMMYQNAAGNRYEISDAQYFISNVVLTNAKGEQYTIKSDTGAHYVDFDVPRSLVWTPTDDIPAGVYTSISFVFGLTPELNKTGTFPNSPENSMSWPASLGGGYHFLMINGKWKDPNGQMKPFNLHTGNYQADNSFVVTLPLANREISKNLITDFVIDMNINKWFESPNLFNFNEYGGNIMQNQTAQAILKANGWDVFEIH